VRKLLYVFGGSVWVVVAVLMMVKGIGGCYGSEWQGDRKGMGLIVSFMSKDVARGHREGGSVLAVRYNSVLKSMFTRERKVDLCCEMEVSVDLESMRGGEILWNCDFVCYAPIEGVVTDIGGVVFRNAGFSSSSTIWLYGFYAGVMMQNVICRPSLYCLCQSYGREVALEGRIEHRWDLLPLGLHGFMLEFSGAMGYGYASKPYGLPYAHSFGRKDYWYYGMALSLIYKLTAGEASIGVSYESNAASKDSWVNYGENYKNNVWFNAIVNFSF
jgi:hypothetical protein